MTPRDQPNSQDYQTMVSALADASRRRDTELGSAEQAYQDNAARAAGELARAEGEAQSADRWAGAAAAQVLDVDREAARLWDELRHARGLRMRALGDTPDPAPVEVLPRIALTGRNGSPGDHPAGRDTPRVLLAHAAELVEVTVRPAGRRPLPRWTLPVLPVAGAVFAAMTSLVGAGLVTFGDTGVWGSSVIRGVGWVAFLVAPSAGVPVAALFTHRRLLARLDIGGVGLTLVGGMVAATLMSLAFAARH